MKTDFKDYVFATVSILLIIAITLFFSFLIYPLIFSLLGVFTQIVSVFLFILLYGLITASYLNWLNKVFTLKEGSYTMSHSQFTLWKHHAVVGELGKLALKIFFPVFIRPIFYSLLGAKTGKNIAIGGTITDPLLTKIEESAVIGQDSVVTSHTIIFDRLFLKSVVIGKGATVGINSVIMPGVKVGENSIVAPNAIVEMDTNIPPNQFWGGVPATKIKDIKKNATT